MNIEQIDGLIEDLKASKTYDQTMYFNECGSPACIAGHILARNGYQYDSEVRNRIDEIAMELLGLPLEEADELFESRPYYSQGIHDYEPTVDDAIATLEHLKKTGEVLWFLPEDFEE